MIPSYMPFFAEFVRLDRRRRLEPHALVRESLLLLRSHLARRPTRNPVTRFRERFGDDLTWLHREGLAAYHAWAFATLRQLGAAFELAARYVDWLSTTASKVSPRPAASFESISTCAKTLILKTARAVNGKKQLDPVAMLIDGERGWDTGMRVLVERYGD